VYALRLHVGEALAAQQVSTEMVEDRQRSALHDIARIARVKATVLKVQNTGVRIDHTVVEERAYFAQRA
jgi:hypothetical protein